ncbi:erythromycin esterase family protein [bacterium]|nr:erythromycin esterase family protein [bacterium]
MGFTVFAMEESLPYGDRINTYVLGGEGDPETLLNNMGNWYIWDTKEVLALIRWMRTYNTDPAHDKKVEFYGIDVTDPVPAFENIHVYLGKVDPGLADYFKTEMDKVDLLNTHIRSEFQMIGKYQRYSDEETKHIGELLSKISDDFNRKRSTYIGKSSENEYEWMLQQLKTALAAHDVFRMGRPGAEGTALTREDGMTNNIRWLLQRDNRRIVLWAHNMHIARSSIYLSGYGQREPEEVELFGTRIGRELGDDLYSIGLLFYQALYKDLGAAEDGMLGAVLSKVGPPVFFLDLKQLAKKNRRITGLTENTE